MTMTYTPSWEKKNNKWDTEPDYWELLENEKIESENAKVADEISLEVLLEDIEEMELEESEFDLEQNFNQRFTAVYVCVYIFLFANNLFRK